MTVQDSEQWYALCVSSKREHIISTYLQEVGLVTFLPLQRDKSTKTKKPPGALFPGYVFCRINLRVGPRLYRIPGILRIAGSGNTPVPIEEQEIEAMRTLLQSSVNVEPWPFMAPDTEVRIVAGPFAGRSGTVIRVGAEKRIIISMQLLQRSISVALPPAWVTP